MKEFNELLATTETLLGPNGCPWDLEQTMKSTLPCVIEESAELVDAINSEDNEHTREELGDLFFVVLFLCKLAEKEKRCSLSEVLSDLNTKLVRRHPHVFGDAKIDTVEQLLVQWHEIKSKEEGKTSRKNILDGIPAGLPALARAEKISKKLIDHSALASLQSITIPEFKNEKELGNLLFAIAAQAQKQGLEAELALRKILTETETDFRNRNCQRIK